MRPGATGQLHRFPSAALLALSLVGTGCHLLFGYERATGAGRDGSAPAVDTAFAAEGARADGRNDGPAVGEGAPPRADAAPEGAPRDQQAGDASTADGELAGC